jgi:hypothetical protein
MHLAVRLGAVLLAVTWIAPAAQAATGRRDLTLSDGTGRDPVPGSALVIDRGCITWVGSSTPLRIPAGATVVDLKGILVTPGIVDIRADQRKAQPEMARVYTAGHGLVFKSSYSGDNAKTLVSPEVDGFAHSVCDQPMDQALL